MTTSSYNATINAEWDTVWPLLVDKIEHPDRYIPGIDAVEIVTRAADYVVRRMRFDSTEVTERITWSEERGEVLFTLQDHPELEGHVVNRLELGGQGTLVLTFEADQRPRHAGAEPPPDVREKMRAAVEHTKQLAEQAQS